MIRMILAIVGVWWKEKVRRIRGWCSERSERRAELDREPWWKDVVERVKWTTTDLFRGEVASWDADTDTHQWLAKPRRKIGSSR